MRRSAMVAALGLFASCLLLSAPAFAQSAALSGRVTSANEGAMEGVGVTAKKAGPTVTASAPTDHHSPLNCVSCHDFDRIVRSQYDGEQFVDIFNRMVGYYPGSTPEHPQRLVGNAQRTLGQGPNMRMVAEYLASVNLSKESWSYPLKTLPRLTGRSNRFILTEYALPRPIIQPHDVVLDEQRMVRVTH